MGPQKWVRGVERPELAGGLRRLLAWTAIAAWRLIVERGYGKVPQQVEVRSALEDLDYSILPDYAL